ncbi:conserved hypothetical protein [Dickeya parazeae Ech586]|uniref:Adenosine deaminase n=1 Tax=Dickeya zeae (strain Ech586) TaxID=590409 RepID=D2BZ67_DICZ5|nr:antiviral RADAR system adenosine deaminase RdrB [Dickeya parazeae]ACZ76762.1 conserved hypothetical protein [Dickeya parazeae Ech586]
MYTQDPRWLIPCACLASDRLFYFHLQQHTGQRNKPDVEQQEEQRLLTRAAKDYQFYFGGRLRNEDIEHNLHSWASSSPTDSVAITDNMTLLGQLAEAFLLWQGNGFEVRRERLEAWLMLCSVLDPAWIIAQAYVQLVRQRVLDEGELVGLLIQQSPFAFPDDSRDTHYADNHVHFNGHGYASLSMLSFVEGDVRLKPDIRWPQREEYPLLESEQLPKQQLPRWLSAYVACLLAAIYPSGTAADNAVDLGILTRSLALPLTESERWSLRDSTLITPPDSGQQQLLYAAMQQGHAGAQRWLLFCSGLLLRTSQPDYDSVLSNLIRASMILRNYMVVSAVGLGQFVEYFGTDVRRADKRFSREQVPRYDLSPSVSREYRVSPGEVIGDERKPNIYHHKLTDFFDQHARWHVPEQAHLVVHFTRGFPKKTAVSRYDKRLTTFRAELLQQVRALEDFAASVTLQETSHQPDIDTPPRTIDVRKLVRGYDVAGNENELPIEVFAPVLRVLRAARQPAGMPFSQRLKRPFITVHAGEDYSHLLSGLRAMDEAVEFCQLREGDRIGHGLALGVDVQHWAQRQRRAWLTAGQHLDNLVWAYHQAVQLSRHTVEHIPVMHELRDKIHHWSQWILGDIYTPNQLYDAWRLRRNWPDFDAMQSEVGRFAEWVPDAQLLMSRQSVDEDNEKVVNLWQRRYLDSGLPEREADRINHTISVNCLPQDSEHFAITLSHSEDWVSAGELRLYEAIQDFLMEKYSRLGLVIEACPTSNIYIGRFEYYHEHPLFRWNPPQPDWLKPGEQFNRYGLRSGPLAVCINTDDSALMPTTIANEHRLMRETAVQFFGIGTWMADLWINTLREKGVEIFKRNHLTQLSTSSD